MICKSWTIIILAIHTVFEHSVVNTMHLPSPPPSSKNLGAAASASAAAKNFQRIVTKLQGSCLCGAITWQVSNIYLSQICVCHCSMCRRFSGSTHIPFAAVERSKLWPVLESFFVKNTMKSYQSSSIATRYFCDTCASPIVFDYHEESHTLWIPMGSLVEFEDDDDAGDDSFFVDPTRDSHIFANERAGYESALWSTNNTTNTTNLGSGSGSGSGSSSTTTTTTRGDDNIATTTTTTIPSCAGWGLYKQDPCQPTQDWNEIPTMETPVRFVNKKGEIIVQSATDEEDTGEAGC